MDSQISLTVIHDGSAFHWATCSYQADHFNDHATAKNIFMISSLAAPTDNTIIDGTLIVFHRPAKLNICVNEVAPLLRFKTY